MRVTSKGQVTIPLAIREKLGLMPNTEIVLELDGQSVRVRPAKGMTAPHRGKRLVSHLRGRGDIRMSTDEILALMRGK